MEEQKPSRKKISPKLRTALLVFFCVCMAGSLVYIGYYAYGYFQLKAAEENRRDLVAALPDRPEYDLTPVTPDGNGGGDAPPQTPRPDFKSRFNTILEINEDFYGLLSIPGLGDNIIDSFVVQGVDNDYYLKHTFEHMRNDRGTFFLDYQARPWFEGRNYAIYGHNMNDGSMFRDLLKYDDINTYAEAPIIEFDTIYGPTTWLIFAAYTCEPDFNYFHTYFTDDGFEELLEEIHMRSNFHTGVEVLPTDTLLTLSTCNYTFHDARFAVHARLLREDEKIEDFVPAAEENRRQKPYNVPMQVEFSEMPAEQTAFIQHTRMKRYYFFTPDDGGIEWYVGVDTTAVQGPYSAWEGKINKTYYSWLAAGEAYTRSDYYIVSGGLNGNRPGLFVLRSSNVGGPYSLISRTAITPAGVNARWPAVYVDSERRTKVIYTADDEMARIFYSIPIGGGAPTILFTSDKTLDERPICVINTDDGTTLLIQEYASGGMKAVYLNEKGEAVETVKVDMSGLQGRYLVYRDARAGRFKYFSEKNGKLTTGNFDISRIPRKTPTVADEPEPNPDAEPEPDPDSDAEPAPSPEPEPDPVNEADGQNEGGDV